MSSTMSKFYHNHEGSGTLSIELTFSMATTTYEIVADRIYIMVDEYDRLVGIDVLGANDPIDIQSYDVVHHERDNNG